MTIEPWLVRWCSRELGALPVEQLLSATLMSDVRAFRLDDGREVVIKSRPDPGGRVPTCLAVQRAVAEAGLPCPRPLTEATLVDGLAVHAEQWVPGGEVARGTDVESAQRSARLYAAVMAVTSRVQLPPPLPNPEWVRWDHSGPGHWPPNALHDNRPGADSLPSELLDIAARARRRLLASAALPHVLGHADWEAQNLRWNDTVVHDWDSIAWLPEPALVGAAAGAFASTETPTLAPFESSEAFLSAYQVEAGVFTSEELEVAWAASLWPALHNARAELLWNHPPVALTALLDQAEARLSQAAA
ncbi:phosphotransferase [Kribbella endophytica]